MTSLILSILLLTIPAVFSQMGDDWYVTIDDLYQDVTLYCNNTEQEIPLDGVPELWMFPDLTNVDKNYTDGKRLVQDDGWELLVKNVSTEDFGLYHCMMLYVPVDKTEPEWFLVKTGINVRGPYFEDIWDKYKQGTIIGISTCLGFLAASALVWLVASHLWEAPDGWYESDIEDKKDTTHPSTQNAYTNSGYVHHSSDEKKSSGADNGELKQRYHQDSDHKGKDMVTEL